MAPSVFQTDHQMLKKALCVVLSLVLMRMMLTLGDSALFCSTPSADVVIRTLLFDVLSLIGLPLIVLLYKESGSTRARFTAIAIIIAGFLLYECVRNSCLFPMFDR